MKQNERLKILYLPKLIIFGLTLSNFFYITLRDFSLVFSQVDETGPKISFGHVTPWYETSDVNIVCIILAASIFLLISTRWSYLTAAVLSGYFTSVGFVHLFLRNIPLLERWRFIQEYESNIFLVYEIQWILAGIVFSVTVFYLIRDLTRKNLL